VHLLLLNQFFYPDVSAAAQLATDLAEDLVSYGFRVSAIASRGTYLGGERLAASEEHRGIRIIRPRSSSFGKGSVAARLADYGSFFVGAFARLGTMEKPDVVLAMSTPPFVAAIPAAMRALRGTRFVYWAQDLYPELAVEFGVLRRASPETRALESVSALILRRADAVITLGEAMAARLVGKGAPPDRVHIVPNWADPAAIGPIQREMNPFRTAHGLQDQRVVLYSGNMGRGHDIETILAAAETLRSRSDVTFLFIGDGVKRPLVERSARDNPQVRLLPYQPRKALSSSLSAGDLHLITQDACTVGLMEPSKLYGAMAVGRPVLFVGPNASEIARTVRREQIGDIASNGDVRGTTAAIERLLGDGPAMGERARIAFERSYSRKTRTAEIARVLRSAVRNPN
jgi:glycosyltransferase involved in cell wall biosynthesis